ncbi:MAG: hypothetical protein US53_C0007G0017 [Candidatus Woesebacteria bacterium GW2011_GWA1_37_7]|uniref:Uncharacterized protein n=1 Tax=Candidatus Woesebacteria bacterium GW2011_GWA1_37_7 TaxID=1618545 RepID=A0A0G0H3N7_9BACT|nr:MAG: hypothetical protein US53_C0007G0017 [Candidatus Woesebacteria bacterium GW2011_GWA1_37_7]
MDKKRARRFNINFKQTASSLRAARQTQIFSHLNRNLPYRIYMYSRSNFMKNLTRLNKRFVKGKYSVNAEKTSDK